MSAVQIIRDSSILFMMLCSLIAMTIGFIKYNKIPELNAFPAYVFASFSETVTFAIASNPMYDQNIGNKLVAIELSLFVLTELFAVYYFFLMILKMPYTKKITRTLLILSLSIILIDWIFFEGFLAYPGHIYVLEAVAIIIPCFLYIFERFKNPVPQRLTQEPAFWIISGLLLYFSCTLPFFLMDSIFNETSFIYQKGISAINYISYSILFLLITKAFLCKKREPKHV